MAGLRTWVRAYRTPFWLGAVFVALMSIFAVIPDPSTATDTAEPTVAPTPGGDRCPACPIDHRCEDGQCVLVEHTPYPCVETAVFDDEAGQCLPTGPPPAPPAPAAPAEPEGPERGRGTRVPQFPGGIGGAPSIGN